MPFIILLYLRAKRAFKSGRLKGGAGFTLSACEAHFKSGRLKAGLPALLLSACVLYPGNQEVYDGIRFPEPHFRFPHRFYRQVGDDFMCVGVRPIPQLFVIGFEVEGVKIFPGLPQVFPQPLSFTSMNSPPAVNAAALPEIFPGSPSTCPGGIAGIVERLMSA